MGKLSSYIVPQGVRLFVKANPPICAKARDLITMARQSAFFVCVCEGLGISEISSLKVYAQGISNSCFTNPGHGEVHTIKTAYQGTGPHNFQSVGFGVRTNFDDSKILNFEKYVNIIA